MIYCFLMVIDWFLPHKVSAFARMVKLWPRFFLLPEDELSFFLDFASVLIYSRLRNRAKVRHRKNHFFLKKNRQNSCWLRKKQYLCTAIDKAMTP